MARGVSRALIAPRLSTRPVNPLLDWSCSSDLELAERLEDFRRPGQPLAWLHLRRLRGDELDQLAPQLAGPPLGGRQGAARSVPALQAQVLDGLQGHSDQVVPGRPLLVPRDSPPASPAWRARSPNTPARGEPSRVVQQGQRRRGPVHQLGQVHEAALRPLALVLAASSVCCRTSPLAAAVRGGERPPQRVVLQQGLQQAGRLVLDVDLGDPGWAARKISTPPWRSAPWSTICAGTPAWPRPPPGMRPLRALGRLDHRHQVDQLHVAMGQRPGRPAAPLRRMPRMTRHLTCPTWIE